MKRLFFSYVSCVILFLLVSTMTSAEMKIGCTLQGSWIGIGENDVVIVSYAGQSASFGTSIEIAPTVDPTLYGFYPSAVEFTNLRGVWKRTSSNTFAYTQIAYGLDANRDVVYIAKNSGNKTLSEYCNIMTVEQTLEVFSPGTNPFEDTPDHCWPGGIVELYRMRVDPLCSPFY